MRATVLSGLTGLMLATTHAISQAQQVDPSLVTQPPDVDLQAGAQDELRAMGAELYTDETLGTSGLACMSCHADFGNYNDTFNQPYPHFVQMAKGRAGLDQVNAAEMVQLCMVVPMATEPLPWDSPELAALATYVEDERERFVGR
jgi:cytochrome c